MPAMTTAAARFVGLPCFKMVWAFSRHSASTGDGIILNAIETSR